MATKKGRGLGRGLDALFADAPVLNEETYDKKNETYDSVEQNSVVYIDINEIKPNKKQPRKVFDDDKIQELADSINEHGIIQPIVLRQIKNGYEIVAGERRWRASRKAGLKKIPCLVRELSDEENMLLAIIENMQRENLNAIEEAEGLEQMIATYGMTQEQVSKSVGKSRPYISNSLRLLKLPQKIRDCISDGSISMGHGRALINVENEDMQLKICDRILKDGLSVRDVEKLVSGKTKKEAGRTLKRRQDPNMKAIEEELKLVLGTKVKIVNSSSRKGKLEIEYFNQDELERLVELIKTLR